MKYAVFINVPLKDVMSVKPKGGLDWPKYGMSVATLRLVKDVENLATGQGWTEQQVVEEKHGDYVNVLPVDDEAKFNAQLAVMEAYCDATPMEDSVSLVSEAQAIILVKSIVIQKPVTVVSE